MRTGVTIDTGTLLAEGCVRFTATMTAAYQPFVPPRQDYVWSWDMVNAQASDGALVWIYRARLPLSAAAEGQGWFLQGRFG